MTLVHRGLGSPQSGATEVTRSAWVVLAVWGVWSTVAWGQLQGTSVFQPSQPFLSTQAVRSGLHFAGSDVQAMQADEWANPMQASLQHGHKLWGRREGVAPSCEDCHGQAKEGMAGVAARLPAWSPTQGRVTLLEDRIRHCQAEHQHRTPSAWESTDLLALSAWVTWASKGMAMSQLVVSEEMDAIRRGEADYHRRQGLLNLACVHCHQDMAGKRLLNDPLSQGQSNAYPLYRLEWQSVGSLERRLRSCFNGVKAELPPWGSSRMRELALYLRWRAQGLPVEFPAVRK